MTSIASRTTLITTLLLGLALAASPASANTAQADLAITDHKIRTHIDDGVLYGDTILVDVTNLGDADAAGFTVCLAQQSLRSPLFVRYDWSHEVPSLAAGETYTILFETGTTSATGTHYDVTADCGDSIAESDEDNTYSIHKYFR